MIVGAGPAGTALALRLARAGVPVTLVEVAASPERQFRGEALMPHGLAALEALGLLPLPAAVPQRPLAGWRFLVDGRELFRLTEPLEPWPDAVPCTLISQPALLRHWLDELRTRTAARVLLGRRVIAPLVAEGRVRGVRLADGGTVAARLVVAADGRRSRLRWQASLPLRHRGSPIDLLWFRLEGHDPSPLEGFFTTVIGPEGLFSVFDSAGGGVQLGWVVDRRDARSPLGAAARGAVAGDWAERFAAQSPPDLAAWLRSAVGGLGQPVPLRVEVGQAERWWCPGLLLLGDAAHPMSPVRAQGINLALRDACLAADVLLEVLGRPERARHEAELDRALAGIEARRRPECEILQRLQEEEARRGNLLRQRPWFRHALALASPWLGPVLAERWRRQQAPLRRGVTTLESGHGGTDPTPA